jgi:hypothetical protein
MTTSRLATAVLTSAVVALPLTACTPSDSDSARTTPPASATAVPTPSASAPTTGQEAGLRIQITVGDQRVTASLDDSAAARDLLAQLPLDLQMRDHGGVEKTGRLPSSLSLDGQPHGADPDVGDIGYYAPGNDLVLYYGDQSYYDGIVVLGRLDGDAAERIARIDGAVTTTVEAIDA